MHQNDDYDYYYSFSFILLLNFFVCLFVILFIFFNDQSIIEKSRIINLFYTEYIFINELTYYLSIFVIWCFDFDLFIKLIIRIDIFIYFYLTIINIFKTKINMMQQSSLQRRATHAGSWYSSTGN